MISLGKKLYGKAFRINGELFRLHGKLFRVSGKPFHQVFFPFQSSLGWIGRNKLFQRSYILYKVLRTKGDGKRGRTKEIVRTTCLSFSRIKKELSTIRK
ncbi:MAG: hypothetical protein IJ910_02230 [Bacteroidaceae bacterium]|nr:hypothetical protein [Bacteroidaceae bacterium]